VTTDFFFLVLAWVIIFVALLVVVTQFTSISVFTDLWVIIMMTSLLDVTVLSFSAGWHCSECSVTTIVRV
jgi:hypothetical protein